MINDLKLRHFLQKTNVTCAAACYRIILSDLELISEKQAVDECLTRKSGTFVYNVAAALTKRGIENYLIDLNIDFIHYSRFLYLNSINRKLYISCNFINQGKLGRPSERIHAIVVFNGFIYDPSEDNPCPIEAFSHTYNKKLHLLEMIMIPT